MENTLFKKIDENPLKGGINIDLVSKESVTLTDSFICSICLNLVLNPVFCEESDCIYCKCCIDSWIKKDKNCPNCRKEFKANNKVSRILKNMLFKVKLNCIYLSEGCDEITEYEKYENHLKICRFSDYACLIPGCNFVSKKKEMLDHIQDCPFLEVNCDFCGSKVFKVKMKEHFLICSKFKRFCPVCKSSIENIEIGIHNNGACYETFYQTYISNSLSSENVNKDFIKDFEETKETNSVLAQKVKSLEQENKVLKEESEKNLKKINQLLEEINKLNSKEIQRKSSNSLNNDIRNTVSYIAQGSQNPLCQNNLHKYIFLRQGVFDVCAKCKKEINCRFQCQVCKSNFCYKCNLPSEKLKCPVGHSHIKLKRNLPFYCDMCMECYEEDSTSYCDKECDIDICEKCYKSKECIIF